MKRPSNWGDVTIQCKLKAATRLRRYGFAAGGLGLSVRPKHRPGLTADTRLPQTQDSFVLLNELERLWRSFLAHYDGSTPLIQTSIWLFRLVPIEARVADFFVPLKPNGFTRGEMLWRSIDRLGARYGRDTVALASQQHLSLQYLGAKIAFTRVPEPVEFVE
jgi:DNA polymerase-4